MPSINGVSSPEMSYASEVYMAGLAKAAQQQQAQQDMMLLQEAVKTVNTPAASSGSYSTTDNLGQNINVNV